MRFSTLSILATIASAAFSFAAPLSSATKALEARCACEDIHDILTDITFNISPLMSELTYLTPHNCTAKVVKPIIISVNSHLTTAIGHVKGLKSSTATSILTTVDGALITVPEVASLVSDLLSLIFCALASILKAASSANISAVTVLVCEVVKLVAVLLQLICNLIGGLTFALVPIINEVCLSVIVAVSLTAKFSFLSGVTWPAAVSVSDLVAIVL
ncbi:hypothetical protein GYMLUDRAFT_241203 [Collybiopsis luxurians FD-317 M1]|uniref:Uncharacterized protein n=1 Tax=Collybiopsis luxurians FD-317 M1 TaxID=944289 RepID=A0A0D0C737_9AGAR|nr:hypothetical protein GYMLUDRAFT_241203 [Collybiopsis luxurians FD-317 M1]